MTDLEKILQAIQDVNFRLDNMDKRFDNLEKDVKDVKKDVKDVRSDLQTVKEVQQIHGQYLFNMYNDIKDLKRYNRKQDYAISENNAYNFEEKENLKLRIDNLEFEIKKLKQKAE